MGVDVWTEEFGGVYTADKKKVLRVPNVKRYKITEGSEETDEKAFEGCSLLEVLYVPESFSEQAAEDTFQNMPSTVNIFCHWDRPYVDEVYDVNEFWLDEAQRKMDEFGVVYANDGKRLIEAAKPGLIGRDYEVPDGVVTICDGAFGGCQDYLVLSVPRSIKVIGDYLFGEEGGKIVIRD